MRARPARPGDASRGAPRLARRGFVADAVVVGDHAVARMRRLAADETVEHVLGDARGIAPARIAIAAAAGKLDQQPIARRDGLAAHAAQLLAGAEMDPASHAGIAAFAAARWIDDAVEGGGQRERRVLAVGDLHDLAEPT